MRNPAPERVGSPVKPERTASPVAATTKCTDGAIVTRRGPGTPKAPAIIPSRGKSTGGNGRNHKQSAGPRDEPKRCGSCRPRALPRLHSLLSRSAARRDSRRTAGVVALQPHLFDLTLPQEFSRGPHEKTGFQSVVTPMLIGQAAESRRLEGRTRWPFDKPTARITVDHLANPSRFRQPPVGAVTVAGIRVRAIWIRSISTADVRSRSGRLPRSRLLRESSSQSDRGRARMIAGWHPVRSQ